MDQDSQQKESQKSRIKELISRGKEQGYLTYAEVNDHLPADITDPEQIEDIISMINDMGIKVSEEAPEMGELLLTENEATEDEAAADEVANALAVVDGELGRTTDPVRMYMREMGRVELLSREGEIAIAKRIEEGVLQMLATLAYQPQMIAEVLKDFDRVEKGELRLSDLISVYIEPDLEASDDEDSESKTPIADAIPDDEAEESGDTFDEDEVGLDPVKVKERFMELREFYSTAVAAEKKHCPTHSKAITAREKL